MKGQAVDAFGYIGAQWQPTRNWTTNVDLYRIDVDDRIVLSSNLQLANTPAWLGLHGDLA